MSNWQRRMSAVIAAAALVVAVTPQLALAVQPDRETVWANGRAWTLLESHITTNASPELLAGASPMYVLAFPKNPAGQYILPAGYAPQCDPCLGVPVPAYHDHLLAGAPGTAENGVRAPRRPILMVYNPAFIMSGHFAPVTDARNLAAAIAANEFLPIAGPGNYQMPLPAVIVGAVVAPVAG
jgi:hypothetical protein